MKKILVKTAVSALLLLVAGNSAFAENSLSISVSATIPEIPGVNAPLLVAIADPRPELIDNALSPQLDQQEESAPTIQEETKGQNQNQEDEGYMVLVKTFYAR